MTVSTPFLARARAQPQNSTGMTCTCVQGEHLFESLEINYLITQAKQHKISPLIIILGKHHTSNIYLSVF